MKTATPSVNESGRLAALHSYGILDTAAQPEFDDFTWIASQVCGTPIALISLIDSHRQWFKSKIGFEATETPREVAFCAHAINGMEIMEVQNAQTDERFRHNKLVIGPPDIRFYAGMPLTTSQGFNLGTLCVIDRVPRQLTDDQRGVLTRLGRLVVDQMDLHRALRDRQRHERCLNLQNAVSRVMADFTSLDEVAPRLLAAMGDSLGFKTGAIWKTDANGHALACVDFWTSADFKCAKFERRTRELRFTTGIGMPGRVWESQSSCWIPDVTLDQNFLRASEAFELGLQTGLGIPILSGDKCLGVIDFYSAENLPRDEQLLEVLQGIGRQIGQFFERKKVEEELLKTNRLLSEKAAFQQAILSSAGAAIITTNPEGLITHFNPEAERMLGYGADELTGKANPGLFHRPDEVVARAIELGCEPGFEVFVGQARNGLTDTREWTFLRKDGSQFPALLTISALRDEAGAIKGFLGIARDLTELKSAEARLREKDERLRTMISSVRDYAILTLDLEGRVVDWNSGAETIKGWTREEIIGRHFSCFYPEDDLKAGKTERELEQVRKEGRFEDEGWRVRKDGSRFWANVVITALRDQAGNLYGYGKVTRDLSERKQNEETLRRHQSELRLLFDFIPGLICFKDTKNNIIRANRHLAETIGKPLAEIEGRHSREFFPKEADAYYADDLEVIRSGLPKLGIVELVRDRDGNEIAVQTDKVPVCDSAGKVVGLVAMAQDITERKRAERKIIESLKEKEALLREVHHRVKNNMQVISSILNLQSGYIKDSEALEIFKDCQGRIRTMALIHEKLYRSEGLAQIDFGDYLQSLTNLLLRSQMAGNVSIRSEFQIEPAILDVDTAIPLGLIANELVSNCLKHAFTGRPQGVVRVDFRKRHDDCFQLVVKDNGKGLPPGFDPDKTVSLGVRLVKILAAQIRGKLEFRSDNGTEFAITFERKND